MTLIGELVVVRVRVLVGDDFLGCWRFCCDPVADVGVRVCFFF